MDRGHALVELGRAVKAMKLYLWSFRCLFSELFNYALLDRLLLTLDVLGTIDREPLKTTAGLPLSVAAHGFLV